MTSANPGGCVLAFDFGTRRIGVAVGETNVGLAHPLATVAAASRDQWLPAVRALVTEWRPTVLVVGLPMHADGVPHAMTGRAKRFARDLESSFGVPVEFCDERFTTRSASSALEDSGIRGRRQKASRDRVAAQLILQDYLDRRRTA